MNANGMPIASPPAHNLFELDNGVIFSSNFDNGNLANVERVPNKPFDFRIWTAPDNLGSEYQSKHCAWFYFSVTGLPLGCVIRIQIVNASNHSGLYKYDMRPVYKSISTSQKWCRIKSSVRFQKTDDAPQLFFEHGVDSDADKIYFAFTYPYTYSMLQSELSQCIDKHINDFNNPNKDSLFVQRELLIESLDRRRVDLITITSIDGVSNEKEPMLVGLFPNCRDPSTRPPEFPNKEIIFVSARVHPGEVPAQHTFQGILTFLLDPNDQCAKELRAKYVFKLIPMLNPDGVYRGHFRMDQLGQNLNRYYISPDIKQQPTIFAAKSLMDHYASTNKLVLYLDMHAHASKRGCFIYGNVLDSIEDQIQNQLYCRLIAMNTPHFDYEGCLFSKEHMSRIDPGDQAKGLTAEGSGRVSTYLDYGLIHSYTLECNYNTSRIGNEISIADNYHGTQLSPASPFTTNPEKYTPNTYYCVGRGCIIAILDIRGNNPCSRITRSKLKSVDRIRNTIMLEVRAKKEFIGKQMSNKRRTITDRKSACVPEETMWRRLAESESSDLAISTATSALMNGGQLNIHTFQSSGTSSMRGSKDSSPIVSAREATVSSNKEPDNSKVQAINNTQIKNNNHNPGILFIPAGKEKEKKRRKSLGPITNPMLVDSNLQPLPNKITSKNNISAVAGDEDSIVNKRLTSYFTSIHKIVHDRNYLIGNNSAPPQLGHVSDNEKQLQTTNNQNGEVLNNTTPPNQKPSRRRKPPQSNEFDDGIPIQIYHSNSKTQIKENENNSNQSELNHNDISMRLNKIKINNNNNDPNHRSTVGHSIKELMQSQSQQQQQQQLLNIPVPTPPPLYPQKSSTTHARSNSVSNTSNTSNNSNGQNSNNNSNSSSNLLVDLSNLNNSNNGKSSIVNSPTQRKDNRKILGKTLHAAGVALLMNSPHNSNEALADLVYSHARATAAYDDMMVGNNNTNNSNSNDKGSFLPHTNKVKPPPLGSVSRQGSFKELLLSNTNNNHKSGTELSLHNTANNNNNNTRIEKNINDPLPFFKVIDNPSSLSLSRQNSKNGMIRNNTLEYVIEGKNKILSKQNNSNTSSSGAILANKSQKQVFVSGTSTTAGHL
eukprot:gene6054-8335_t